jgi:hypothetical protein
LTGTWLPEYEEPAAQEVERKRHERGNGLRHQRRCAAPHQSNRGQQIDATDANHERGVGDDLAPRGPLRAPAEQQRDAQQIIEHRCTGKCHRRRNPRRRETAEQREKQYVGDGAQAADQQVPRELHRQRRVRHVVTHHAVQRAEPILRANLLALGVGTSCVRHAHLVDAQPHPRDARDDFGLETKPLLAQVHLLQDLAAEHLVTGLHVREVQIREHVRQQRQEPVADRMPEVQHAVRIPSEEPRPDDNVGASVCKRFNQAAQILRVVLEIRVLHRDEVAGRAPEAGVEGGALALIHLVNEQMHLWMLAREGLGQRTRSIG